MCSTMGSAGQFCSCHSRSSSSKRGPSSKSLWICRIAEACGHSTARPRAFGEPPTSRTLAGEPGLLTSEVSAVSGPRAEVSAPKRCCSHARKCRRREDQVLCTTRLTVSKA